MLRRLLLSLFIVVPACTSDPPTSAPVDASADAAVSTDAADAAAEPPPVYCDLGRAAPPPIGTNDVVYSTWSNAGCSADKTAFCGAEAAVPRILACDAVRAGYFWGLGSVAVRVFGREAGKCVIDVGTEVEGGVIVHRCRLPLPLAPWAGLAASPDGSFLQGIAEHCEDIDHCNLLSGAPDDCRKRFPRPPVCNDL